MVNWLVGWLIVQSVDSFIYLLVGWLVGGVGLLND